MSKAILKHVSAVILIELIGAISLMKLFDTNIPLILFSLLNTITIVLLILDERKEVLDYEVNCDKYNTTLLLCLFLGLFGVHRLRNGRNESGTYMLIVSVIFITLGPLIFIVSVIFAMSKVLIVLGMLGAMVFVTMFIVWFPALVLYYTDIWMILCERFKSKGRKILFRRNKHFLKTWSSYVAIIVGISFPIIVYAFKVF